MPRGDLTVRASRRGKQVLRWGGDNLVVASSRDALARLVAGLGAAKTIKYIGFGTSAKSASPDDVGITDPYYVELGAAIFPATGHVQFPWVLREEQANGMVIREFGLFTADKTLFARKVRAEPIAKTDLELEGEWDIFF